MRSAFLLAFLPLALAASFAQADDLNNASDGGHTHWRAAQPLDRQASVPTGSMSPAARPAARAIPVRAAAPAAAAPALLVAHRSPALRTHHRAVPLAPPVASAASDSQALGNASDGGYTYWLSGQ